MEKEKKKPVSASGKEKPELLKLKKHELLEIMLKQGEEIDRLRSKVEELEKALDQRKIDLENAGSIAEASLKVTKVFEEAEKAAQIYLDNIRRRNE
ncbi:MAG: DNA repair protein [Firmicutes bacterium]|nr:DNA repair protein [Bacillota bacterium]